MKKEDKKPVYILCPRCELNYIKSKEKYCTVCKAEMGLVDPSILLPDDEEAGLEKLCPVCHVNYIGDEEEICFLCLKEREERDAADKKNEWDEIEHDPDGISAPIGILPLEEESLLSDEDAEEEEESEHEAVDDFDYPEIDDEEYYDDEDDEEDYESDDDEEF